MIVEVDVHSLAQLSIAEAQSCPYPWSEQQLRDTVVAGKVCLKFQHQQHCIGYALLMPVVDEMELLNFVIFKNWQGRGFGAKYLLKLCQWAQDNAAISMSLEVRESNHAARALYEKIGFAPIAIRKQYYRTIEAREDAIIMRGDLRAITRETANTSPR